MAVRPDFRRLAVSIQYHGSSFLGLQKSGPNYEDCITREGTDLRGYRSISTHLETALEQVFGEFENLHFSSRTDRGVHALKNTLHVDVPASKVLDTSLNIRRALNYHLNQQRRLLAAGINRPKHNVLFPRGGGDDDYIRLNPSSDVRVLTAALAPTAVWDPLIMDHVPWHARHHARQRVYLYRLFHATTDEGRHDGVPFEWDRSWRLYAPLDIGAMRDAAALFTGRRDFTSFRSAGCQAPSPVVHLQDITIAVEPYRSPFGDVGGLFDRDHPGCNIISLVFTGEKFLYRMVRNIVGVLVKVGRSRLSVSDAQQILEAKDRRLAPSPALASGLFLVDVKYDNLEL